MNGENEVRRKHRAYLKAEGWKSPQMLEECINNFVNRVENTNAVLGPEDMRDLLKQEFGGVTDNG